jgi:excisionase family DNA binding protein
MERGELVPMAEAAKYLGVSRNTARRLIEEERVPTFATPLDKRRRLVRLADLERFRSEIRPQQAPEAKKS